MARSTTRHGTLMRRSSSWASASSTLPSSAMLAVKMAVSYAHAFVTSGARIKIAADGRARRAEHEFSSIDRHCQFSGEDRLWAMIVAHRLGAPALGTAQ